MPIFSILLKGYNESMSNIIHKVNEKRQTVKSYSDKKISPAKWGQIINTIHWAPSSHGFEPYRVLTINKENKLREELKPLMWNQGVITEADKLVIFISLKREVFASKEFILERVNRKNTLVLDKEGEELEKVNKAQVELIKKTHLDAQEKTDDWSMKQTYIAMGMAMYAATILKIGSTPIEGFDREAVEKLLLKNKLIDKTERVALATAFGYAKTKSAYAHWGTGKRVRVSKEEKFKEI